MFFSALVLSVHCRSFIITAQMHLRPHWDGAGNGVEVWICHNVLLLSLSISFQTILFGLLWVGKYSPWEWFKPYKKMLCCKEHYGLQSIIPLFFRKGQMTCTSCVFTLRFCSCFDIRGTVALMWCFHFELMFSYQEEECVLEMVNFRGWGCCRSKDYNVEEEKNGLQFLLLLLNIFDTKARNYIIWFLPFVFRVYLSLNRTKPR